MDYKGLHEIFSNWSASKDITTDIFAIGKDDTTHANISACMQGTINSETADTYTQRICMYKSFQAKDFSLFGYKSKEYGVGELCLLSDIWNEYKTTIGASKAIKDIADKSVTGSVYLTIVKVNLNEKAYYFVATQEPSEKMYKKKKVYSVGKILTSLKPNEFFTMCGDFDCVVDENQGCFYSLKNTSVISLFNLKEAIKNKVKSSEKILDDWNFIDNIDDIKNHISQQNVYEPLFNVFRNEEYVKQLKEMSTTDFKTRILRVSNGKITENDFKDDKLIVSRKNRALFLNLLAKKMKYNIATDSVEE